MNERVVGVERCVIAARLSAHLAFLPSLAKCRKTSKLPGFHGKYVAVRVLFGVPSVWSSPRNQNAQNNLVRVICVIVDFC